VTARRLGRSSPARALAVVVAAAALCSACAERIGKQAAAGAMAELQRRHDENPDQRPAKVAAGSAAEGAMEALETPEQQARIDRLIARAVASATQSAVDTLETPEQQARIQRMVTPMVAAATQIAVEDATREMLVALGPNGQGPLALSLSRTGEQVATSAAGGIGTQLAALVPECTGPDQLACVERRLQRTAHETAASFTAGVKESIGWQVMLLVFALGAGGGLLGAWLWSLRHYRRRTLRMA